MTKRERKRRIAGLKGSVKKWEYLSSGEATHEPICALCVRYGPGCDGCPLAETGNECWVERGNLYAKWDNATGSFNLNEAKRVKLAKKLLALLKRLLKKEEKLLAKETKR